MRHVNNLEPPKFRTGKEQICYLIFNRFLTVGKQTCTGEIFFSVVNLIDKLNKFENSHYKLCDELRESDNDRVQSKHRIWEFDQSDVNRPRATTTNRRNDNGTGKNPQQISKKPRFLPK